MVMALLMTMGVVGMRDAMVAFPLLESPAEPESDPLERKEDAVVERDPVVLGAITGVMRSRRRRYRRRRRKTIEIDLEL
jgi:hypothetical protein